MRGEISYSDNSKCQKNILNVGGSLDTTPNLGDLLTIRKILDGRVTQKYIDCIDSIYPEEERGLEFRWQSAVVDDVSNLYHNTKILQIRNFFKPTHSNFNNLDSYDNWVTLYFGNDDILHTVHDDTWSPVYIHPANISLASYSEFPTELTIQLDTQVMFNEISGFQLYIENRPVYILNPLIEVSLQNTNIFYNESKSPIVEPILEPSDFHFKWEGKNPSGGRDANLPITDTGEYDTKVFWGDGTVGRFDTNNTEGASHIYTFEKDNRNVILRGTIKGISFEENENQYETIKSRQRYNQTQISTGMCSDERKMCEDGTLVTRNENNNCAFYDCPKPVSIIHTDKDGCFFLLGDDIQSQLNFNTQNSTHQISSPEISFGDGYLTWKVNYISDANSEYTDFQKSQFDLALERWCPCY